MQAVASCRRKPALGGAAQSLVLLFVFLSSVCHADVYMHNPRGSNDRNCERNANRDNGNRLFNSQNNQAGGYACPRGVGDGNFQPESGQAVFNSVDTATGATTTFTQNKRMYYYAGSILPIEWTSQHGCGGNSKVSCEIILQYACEDTLDPQVDNFWPWVQNKAEAGTTYYGKQHFRDATSTPQNVAAPRDGVPRDSNDAATDTINDNEASAIPNTVETRRFGMHESYDYYQLCQRTERNKGLYTADQAVVRNDRRGTRQNPNGDRHGFECPEERDYYPWWAPSPWIDIAVLTDSGLDLPCYPKALSGCSKRCLYYMNNTMNSHKKGYCDVDHSAPGATVSKKLADQKWQTNQWYNNANACTKAGYKWYAVSHADNLNLLDNNFVCGKTQFSRVNQLGNAAAGTVVSEDALTAPASAAAWATDNPVVEGLNANRFLWTIPYIPTAKTSNYFTAGKGLETAYQSCTLRIRYNISSADFQPWPVEAVNSGSVAPMVDSRNNSRVKNDPRTPLKQDPYVYIGPGDSQQKGDMFLSLAVNTNQYSRTFQDRSYVFSIKPLPTTDVPASTQSDTPAINYLALNQALKSGGQIYNVNVRGKRGNIVQVYPSVEYDFVPNQLKLKPNDVIHWQWTGSDYNPRRGCNDGEGGPPDTNSYSTDANANLNPRADRSNVVFTVQMGANVPRDYLGYSRTANTTYANRQSASHSMVLDHAPCFDPAAAVTAGTTPAAAAADCYSSVMRLAYLNQQLDGGSLVLRAGKNCLTQAELEAIADQNTANYHPLNCAKLNAKPYPYFDGGLQIMRKLGWFSYFSSRNNNFSNRQQIGVICVGQTSADCTLNSAGVLQTGNTVASSGNTVSPAAAQTSTVCYDAAGRGSTTACVYQGPPILTTESIAFQQADSDATGDGNRMGCESKSDQLSLGSASPGQLRVDQQVGLAIGLLALGIFVTWLAYYCYNRYSKQRDDAWLRKPRQNSFKGQPPLSANADADADAIPSKSSGLSWSAMFGRTSDVAGTGSLSNSSPAQAPPPPPARLDPTKPPKAVPPQVPQGAGRREIL